jgi:glutamate/tyrosine decarboxylase-like PLP-dependent enzyme
MEDLTSGEAAALRAAAEAGITMRQGVSRRAIGANAGYGAMAEALGGPVPEVPGDPEAIIDDLIREAAPGLAGITSPRFLGWVTGASHPVGVAADWLAGSWGQNSVLADVTPAAAAVEEIAGRWMLDLLDLPREAGFGLTTGATMANTIALAAARHAVLARAGWDVEARGLYGAPEVTVIVGAEAHSTVFMALRVLGFGSERVVTVGADGQGAIKARAFDDAMASVDGPVIVLAQAGHINSGAFDPIGEIVAAARGRNAWVHVDGAFGLWARACPEYRHLAEGLEGADSWAVDGHKWLQVPYDCGVVFVRDREALQRAMSFSASYIESSAARDPMDFHPELSSRARGFALWATIRALGRSGVAEMVGRHCRLARRIADGLAAVPGLVVLNDVVLNQVAVACETGDADTKALLARLQAEGRCFPSGAVWKDRAAIRISVCSGRMDDDDADETVAAFRAACSTLLEIV